MIPFCLEELFYGFEKVQIKGGNIVCSVWTSVSVDRIYYYCKRLIPVSNPLLGEIGVGSDKKQDEKENGYTDFFEHIGYKHLNFVDC